MAAIALNGLDCVICGETYHANCCGSDGLTDADVALLNSVGWACISCTENARSAFDKLQARNSKISMLIAQLTQRMTKLENAGTSAKTNFDIDNSTNGGSNKSSSGGSDGRSAGVAQMDQTGGVSMDTGGAGDGGGWITQGRRGARTYANAAASDPSTEPIEPVALVQKTVTVLNRKKSNLFVSGLLETGSEQSDSELFVSLCMNYLSSKHRVIKSVRLGQPSAKTNTRLLLVSQ